MGFFVTSKLQSWFYPVFNFPEFGDILLDTCLVPQALPWWHFDRCSSRDWHSLFTPSSPWGKGRETLTVDMAPSRSRSPRTGLRSPPPSSPPATSGHPRANPSITPRRFKLFFTPRNRVSKRPSSSRKALRDFTGPALNSFRTPSSTLKVISKSAAGDGFVTPLYTAKRPQITNTPPASSPMSSPALRPSAIHMSTTELLSPLSGFLPPVDLDEDHYNDDVDYDDLAPYHRQPLKPITPFTRQGLAAHRLQRELGALPCPGRSMLRFPVAGMFRADIKLHLPGIFSK